VIAGVERDGFDELVAVVHAVDALGLGLGLAQGRQQHACQDGDDRDHDQQFD